MKQINKELYKLTNPQKSIWLIEQFFNDSNVNNICGTVLIHDKVNFTLLQKAIKLFVKDNDSFRLRLSIEENKEIKQYFTNYVDFTIELVDLQDNSKLKDLEKSMVSLDFSLKDKPLFCFKMFRFPDGDGGLIVTAHHLIADACTAGLVASKIITIYTSFLKNEVPDVPATSYIDYIESEKKYLSSDKFQKDKSYWESVFETVPEIGVIPSVNSSIADTSAGARETFILSQEKIHQINDFCNKYKISIFNFFMAIYSIYIGRVSQLDDFVLGTPILNRSTFIEKNTPGMFISTVPFRFSINNESSFVDFTKKIAMDSLGMFRHQKYPYQSILEYIRSKNPSQPNLYDILISYQNTRTNRNIAQVPYDVNWTFNNSVADSMQIHLFDINDEGSLNIAYDYRLSKYSIKDITSIHNRILNMIDQILSVETISIQDIEIVVPEEKQKLLYDFNNTDLLYDRNKTIIDFFEEQVEKNPNNTALIFEDKKFTYLELNEKANQLAHYFLKNNINNNQTIGILIPRSPEMVIGLLAILKIGATYLPIDPDYPIGRISYILKDSQSKLILTTMSTFEIIDDSYEKLDISLQSDIYSSNSKENLHTSINPDTTLYLIYTSGSTGNPKGVMVTYDNMTNFVLAENQHIKFSPEKVMLSVTTICFDIFALELWSSLSNGLSIVLCNETEQNSPSLLRELCLKHNVTMIQTTPSRFNNLLADTSNLDYFNNFTDIMVGGEPLPSLLLEKIKAHASANIFNMYGPTETTVWSTIKDVTHADCITIGHPIANTTCYILDKNHKLLPPNTPGYLYIGGNGVSKGYWNRPDLTNKNFILSPFSDNKIIYNTNDLAYLNTSGELVHLGRTDFQVKIRGYRIELSEIENRLLKYPNITHVVVMAKDSKFLVCYYVSKEDIPSYDLTNYLLNSLPNYMVPSYFIRLDLMPLTLNGKIDRKQLPPFVSPQLEEEYASTPTEKKISEVLADILKVEKVDINTPFLNLGLDSLGIIQAQTTLLPYHFSITTQDFYKYPCIKDLAKKIDSNSVQYNEQDLEIPTHLKHTQSEFDCNILAINLKEDCLNNVFLTGANGFLGVHILHELLYSTKNKVYCLVRGNNYSHSVQRLVSAYQFYFHEDLTSKINDRVFVIHGDVEYDHLGLELSDLNAFVDDFSTIIHTAAIVKHYGSFSYFEKVNINGTKNISEFAYVNHKKLVHISSISVSGNYLVKQYTDKVSEFNENSLYIGQHYSDNVYVCSKLEAERIVYSYAEKGLPVQVLRIGILAGRFSDGVFQEKIEENAFYNRIRSMINISAVTENMLNQEIEFTPVDFCAKAIVLLSKTENCWNRIYHLYDPFFTRVKNIVKILQDFNISVNLLDNEDFNNYLKELSENISKKSVLNSIINDIQYTDNNLLSINYNYTVPIESKYTQNYLHLLGFEWPTVSDEYVKKLLAYMKFVHFI